LEAVFVLEKESPMHRNRRSLVLIFMLSLLTAGFLMAQGHGGPGGDFPHDSTGGGWNHDGPGWDGDSTGCDSSGWNGGHGGGHGNPGHEGQWGHGDSTGCDSSGFGGHHGGGHGNPGHGWGQGDSTVFDSISVSGFVSILTDTIAFGGGLDMADSGVFIHSAYLLDVDADEIADYRLLHLQGLAHHDSTFVLPMDGDQVTVTGFVIPGDDDLDRILVQALVYGDETETAGSLMAVNPVMADAAPGLNASNYPNPFNPSTSIEFSLSQAGHTSLKIYDIRGVEVATLADSYFTSGVHTISFSPGTLSAGTYLYVLEANGQRVVGRLAYLK
jgi:hypothetical protein